MPIIYTGLPTPQVRALRAGGPDANGQPAERAISRGTGNLCRHCLRDVPDGQAMLIFALRPFPALQPYAETGPAFLCACECAAYRDTGQVPRALQDSPDFLIKGYAPDDRIVYGTGCVVPTGDIATHAERILGDPGVAYIHVRSARNNCWQGRIDRA